MEEAIRKSGRTGHRDEPPVGTAVPENSAVGESASNGRAERTVQEVEDLLRVNKLALEAHIGEQIPSTHPVVRWMVKHVPDIFTKLRINHTGQSPYEQVAWQESPREESCLW